MTDVKCGGRRGQASQCQRVRYDSERRNVTGLVKQLTCAILAGRCAAARTHKQLATGTETGVDVSLSGTFRMSCSFLIRPLNDNSGPLRVTSPPTSAASSKRAPPPAQHTDFDVLIFLVRRALSLLNMSCSTAWTASTVLHYYSTLNAANSKRRAKKVLRRNEVVECMTQILFKCHLRH